MEESVSTEMDTFKLDALDADGFEAEKVKDFLKGWDVRLNGEIGFTAEKKIDGKLYGISFGEGKKTYLEDNNRVANLRIVDSTPTAAARDTYLIDLTHIREVRLFRSHNSNSIKFLSDSALYEISENGDNHEIKSFDGKIFARTDLSAPPSPSV